jgi:hypothetical protein
VLDLKSGQEKTLLRGGSAAEYVDTGHLVYATVANNRGTGQPMSGTLWAVGFDLERLALRGEPVRVSETLQLDMLGPANYAISSTGTLAYLPAKAYTRFFVWVGRNGQQTPIKALPPRAYQHIGLSPDGTRLAFVPVDRVRAVRGLRATLRGCQPGAVASFGGGRSLTCVGAQGR